MTTSQPDPQYDLAQAIQLTLDCLKQASLDAHTTSEAREAQRYLYERIINYYGLMRRRKLTNSIEFLIPYHDGKIGCTTSGWYFKVPTLNGKQQAFNWKGPFSSYKQALAERDKDKPKTRMALATQILDQMAEEDQEDQEDQPTNPTQPDKPPL